VFRPRRALVCEAFDWSRLLFCLARAGRSGPTGPKSLFFSRETQFVIFFLFALFVGLNSSLRKYQVYNYL
jgi:hypothetical protein